MLGPNKQTNRDYYFIYNNVKCHWHESFLEIWILHFFYSIQFRSTISSTLKYIFQFHIKRKRFTIEIFLLVQKRDPRIWVKAKSFNFEIINSNWNNRSWRKTGNKKELKITAIFVTFFAEIYSIYIFNVFTCFNVFNSHLLISPAIFAWYNIVFGLFTVAKRANNL